MAIGIEDIAPLLPADWPGTKLPEMPGDLACRVTGGFGGDVPAVVHVREGRIDHEVDLWHGQKTGLFLDQRENRRRLLVNHVAADFPLFAGGPAGAEVLNTFAYTCGFSVAAAAAPTMPPPPATVETVRSRCWHGPTRRGRRVPREPP